MTVHTQTCLAAMHEQSGGALTCSNCSMSLIEPACLSGLALQHHLVLIISEQDLD